MPKVVKQIPKNCLELYTTGTIACDKFLHQLRKLRNFVLYLALHFRYLKYV